MQFLNCFCFYFNLANFYSIIYFYSDIKDIGQQAIDILKEANLIFLYLSIQIDII